MKIILKDVRLSFPDLWQAKSIAGGEPRFGASFLLDMTNPTDQATKKQIEHAIQEVCKEKWGKTAAQVFAACRTKDTLCLHDGNAKPQFEGYPGNFYLAANSKRRPVIIDTNKAPLTETDGRPYSGCYVNVSVDIWAQDSPKFGVGVFAQLIAVQFKRDGEAFAGGESYNEADFEDESGGDGGSAFDFGFDG